MLVRLQYSPTVVGVDATVNITDVNIGGFLCSTSGSITITGTNDFGAPVPLVATMPVTAGGWVFIPLFIGPNGGQIVASGGASGVLAA